MHAEAGGTITMTVMLIAALALELKQGHGTKMGMHQVPTAPRTTAIMTVFLAAEDLVLWIVFNRRGVKGSVLCHAEAAQPLKHVRSSQSLTMMAHRANHRVKLSSAIHRHVNRSIAFRVIGP